MVNENAKKNISDLLKNIIGGDKLRDLESGIYFMNKDGEIKKSKNLSDSDISKLLNCDDCDKKEECQRTLLDKLKGDITGKKSLICRGNSYKLIGSLYTNLELLTDLLANIEYAVDLKGVKAKNDYLAKDYIRFFNIIDGEIMQELYENDISDKAKLEIENEITNYIDKYKYPLYVAYREVTTALFDAINEGKNELRISNDIVFFYKMYLKVKGG